MTDRTSERVEVHKKEKRMESNGPTASSVERHEEYKNVDAATAVREERVVKDSAAPRIGLARKASQFIWLMGGLLEAILGLRFLLKLIGANPNSPFVLFIYEFTELFLWPFQAMITSPSTDQGIILEIPTLFAMLVYGLATWAVVKIIELVFVPSTSERVTVYRREES